MVDGFSYLFVDLEWEEAGSEASPEDKILEVGARKTDTNATFMKFINPKKMIKRRVLNLLKLSAEKMHKGTTEQDAINGLATFGANTGVTVVWSEQTRIKLENIAEKCKHLELVKHVIVLQDLIKQLMNSDKGMPFNMALNLFGAKYDARFMHNAGFDAECMKDLFYKVCEKYEEVNPILKNHIFMLNNSDIYHFKECSCIKDKITDNDWLLSFKDVAAFRPCKRCLKQLNFIKTDISEEESKKLLRILRYKGKAVNDAEMDKLAEYFKLGLDRVSDCINVMTGYSMWKVYMDKGFAVKLKHENHSGRSMLSNSVKQGAGFHTHDKFPPDIYSLFSYISTHDSGGNIRTLSDDLERREKTKRKLKKNQKRKKVIEYDEWEEYQNEVDEYKSNRRNKRR